MSTLKKDRVVYLDFLRIISCFLVIFNHLAGYYEYQKAENPVSAFFYMFFTMVTRINVPIFFMISGSLLLSKDIGYNELFLKRILRIALALFIGTATVYILSKRHDLSSIDVGHFIRDFFGGKIVGQYWYLYAYLGFLLMHPFLRNGAKNFGHREFVLVILVHFALSTVIPLGNYIINQFGIASINIKSDFQVPFMTGKAFFYPLIGFYLDRVVDVKRIPRKIVWAFPTAALIGIIISSAFTYHEGVTSGYTQSFVQTFDYVTAISVFVTTKYLFTQTNDFGNNWIVKNAIPFVGSLTFGIYLFEPALKLFYNRIMSLVPLTTPLVLSFFWCIFSMIICGIVTYLLKKIPGVKTIL